MMLPGYRDKRGGFGVWNNLAFERAATLHDTHNGGFVADVTTALAFSLCRRRRFRRYRNALP